MIDNYEYITVRKSTNRYETIGITSKSEFFRTPLIITITEDKIIFEKPGIDHTGRIIKPTETHKGGGWYTTMLPGKVPIGKHYFDEDDSNEDIKVCYFEDQQDITPTNN